MWDVETRIEICGEGEVTEGCVGSVSWDINGSRDGEGDCRRKTVRRC